MASDHQVALSRPHRANQSSIQKTTRQAVPAFLQKLYEMLNDARHGDLIRWSDAGDSFFVLDHERFAREVLGRWFKHQNFPSFVRQLNMYGFHKIPHLQQGVLRGETDTEFWNFAHPSFHRGQPDLLCLIQRKKQVPQRGDEVSLDVRDSGASNASPAATTLSSGQILDIHSIVNGIAAIKRHQTTISAELNELKRSNELLWQDSLAARAKHQKQQDTINRIVKFLAGVFGHQATSHKPDTAQSPPSRAVVPRKRSRLMIEDARREGLKVGVTDVIDEDDDHHFFQDDVPTSSTSQYPTVETPSAASPSPSLASEAVPVDPISQPTPINPTGPFSPNGTRLDLNKSQSPHPQDSPFANPLARAVTPTHSPPNGLEFDPRVSGFLSQLTPSQIQQILNTLSSSAIPDALNAQEHSEHGHNFNSSQLTSYQPFDFSPFSSSNHLNHDVGQDPPDLSLSPLQLPSFPPSPPSLSNRNSDVPELRGVEDRLDRSWKATSDIDKDVNALNNSIHSLIKTFGLEDTIAADPGTIDQEPGAEHGKKPIHDHLSSSKASPHHDRLSLSLSLSPSPPSSSSSSLPPSRPTKDQIGTAANSLGDDNGEFDFDAFFNNFAAATGSNASGGAFGTGNNNSEASGSGSNSISPSHHASSSSASSSRHNGVNAGVEDNSMMDYTDMPSTAFLDELPSPSDAAAAVAAAAAAAATSSSGNLNGGVGGVGGAGTGGGSGGGGFGGHSLTQLQQAQAQVQQSLRDMSSDVSILAADLNRANAASSTIASSAAAAAAAGGDSSPMEDIRADASESVRRQNSKKRKSTMVADDVTPSAPTASSVLQFGDTVMAAAPATAAAVVVGAKAASSSAMPIAVAPASLDLSTLATGTMVASDSATTTKLKRRRER